jgi:carbonic anhydrase
MLDELLKGNERFAEGWSGELPPLPRRGLVVLTCMDHRVDPLAALGLEPGDAMVLRNAGGRVTPAFLRDLRILELLAAEDALPESLSVTGLVYDVEDGRVELVERRSPLRAE